MILVTLGTQDKSFHRLLEEIDRLIQKKVIQDRVVVQAGDTKFESKRMEIFDLLPMDEFESYMEEADLVITHGGIGSILTALKYGKKVIAVPRLSKYKEHTNDHQLQIIEDFGERNYIIGVSSVEELESAFRKVKKFKPKKYKTNNKKFVALIENYIEKDDHVSWYNRYHRIIQWITLSLFTSLFSFGGYLLLVPYLGTYLSILIVLSLSCLYLSRFSHSGMWYRIVAFILTLTIGCLGFYTTYEMWNLHELYIIFLVFLCSLLVAFYLLVDKREEMKEK